MLLFLLGLAIGLALGVLLAGPFERKRLYWMMREIADRLAEDREGFTREMEEEARARTKPRHKKGKPRKLVSAARTRESEEIAPPEDVS